MTRIIIESPSGGGEIEVEQATFDAGYFKDWVYVRDAGPSASTEPTVFDSRFRDIVTSPTSLGSSALRAAYGLPTQTGNAGKFLATDGTTASWGTPTGGGATLTVAATATSAATLVAAKHTPVDATTAALTMTLPTGAAAGTLLSAEKFDSTANPVTLSGSIRGVGASTVQLVWAKEALLLVADAAGSWWPVAGHKTKASLDAAYAAPGDAAARGLSSDYGQPPTSLVLVPAPSSPTVVAGDDFAGTAGTALSGRTSDLGTPATWTVSGTWQLDGSGNVGPTTNTDKLIATLPIPAAYANSYTVEVSTTFHYSGTTSQNPGLIFRYVDGSNFWYFNPLQVTGVEYFGLYRRTAGGDSLISKFAVPSGIVDGTPLTMRVDVWGRDVTLYINGVLQFTYTSAATDVGLGFGTVGLRQGIGNSYPTPIKFSAFTVSQFKGPKLNVPRVNPLGSQQVLTLGTAGSWDDTDINNPNVVWDPANRQWVMYYSGFNSTNPGTHQGLGLAYATSLSGPWTKDARNPVVGIGNNNIENGGLAYTRGRWLRASENGSGDSLWFTSPDLITWTALTVAGLPMAVHDPFLRVNQNGLLELWYGNGSPNASIYKATSTDGGATWTGSTTPVLGPPPILGGSYRGNGEPTVWVPPGREGTEMIVLCDVTVTTGQGAICAAITVDGGTTWRWRNIAGGSGTGFDSFQKFDSFPVYAEGAFHIFHSAATASGTGVNINTTIGHMAVQFSPNPKLSSAYAPPYQ